MKEEKRYTDITEIYYGRDILCAARVLIDIVELTDLQLLSDCLFHLSLINILNFYAVFGLNH